MSLSPSDFAERVKGAVRNNFNQSADIYRAFEEKHHFFYALTQKLAEWMELKNGATILDIGCGNGVSCEALHERYQQSVIYGIDLSEAMITDAKKRIHDPHIHLLIGDGENLAAIVGNRLFDAVMYNASIFVFPNPAESFLQAKSSLKPGGSIGFSFYPRVYAPGYPDLIGWAYGKLGMPLPKFRTITSWEKTCQALEGVFGAIETTTWETEGSVSFLVDFFSIPAQSASLFPKLSYKERAKMVRKLFRALREWEHNMTIGWDMAKAKKP